MSERTMVRQIDRSVSTATAARTSVQQPATVDLLRRATADAAQSLDAEVRGPLSVRLGHDFSRVRVHSGPNSARAAARIGARAYTLGADIHLGHEAAALGGRDRASLLAHEAVHTAQQAGVSVAPHAGLAVGDPHSAAEVEAEQVARAFDAPTQGSRSLAMRDAARLPTGAPAIARVPMPLVQRDLKNKYKTADGDFDLNLKTESHAGVKSGMSGTIKFNASATAPDANSIRLLQVIRLEDLTTGKDYVWTGGDAGRAAVATKAAPGVNPGFGVDFNPAAATPRSAKTDADVSPFYRDYWANASSSQDGSKKGATIKEASLWDYPGWDSKCRYSFETGARNADTGYNYATVSWGFTISDGAKGTVTAEHASASFVPSSTFTAAVGEFNKVYKNRGAATAP